MLCLGGWFAWRSPTDLWSLLASKRLVGDVSLGAGQMDPSRERMKQGKMHPCTSSSPDSEQEGRRVCGAPRSRPIQQSLAAWLPGQGTCP